MNFGQSIYFIDEFTFTYPKRPKKMLRKIVAEVIPLFFIGLFTYVATRKLLDYEAFASVVGTSPLFQRFQEWKSLSPYVIWIVPASQLFIVGLLLFGYRLAGFLYSIIFIGLLTIYILYILGFAEYVPCSCSGVLTTMTWLQHLYFNIVCLVTGFTGFIITLNRNERKSADHNLFRSLKKILLVQVK